MDLLDNIRIFRRVHERQSFSAAAAELGLGQPAVSKAIASLERKLGVALFRRSTRGLSLTESGAKLLNLGGPLLERADEVLAAVKEESAELSGPLRLTASLAFARLVLEPLSEEFLKLHPKVRLHLQLSDGYVDLVERGIDLAIRVGPLADSNLRAQKIGASRRAFFASRAYTKRHGTPTAIEDLNEHRLLFFTGLADRPSWPYRDGQGRPRTFTIKDPYLQSDGSDYIREAVIAGRGIALMPTWMMMEEERKGTIVRLLESHAPASAPVYLVSVGAQDTTAKQQAFAGFIKEKFAAMATLRLE